MFIISLYASTMTIINLNLKTKYRYILKKLNIMKNINIFCQGSETHILYRFITHRVQYFNSLFLDILMIMAYRY